MRIAFYIVVFAFSAWHGRAQSTFSKIIDFQGQDGYDRINSMSFKKDTLFAMVSKSSDGILSNVVVKMNKQGELVDAHKFPWLKLQIFNNIHITEDKLLLAKATKYEDSVGYELLILNHNLDSLNHIIYPKLADYEFFSDNSIVAYDKYYVIAGNSKINEDEWPAQLYWIDTTTLKIDTIINAVHGDSISMVFRELYVDSSNLLTVSFTQLGNHFMRHRGFIKFNQRKEIEWTFLAEPYTSNWGETSLLLKNDWMIYEQKDDNGLGNSGRELICINKNKDEIWRNKERGNLYGGKYIYTLSETAAGDVLGCGQTDWQFDYIGNEVPTPADLHEKQYRAAYVIKIDGQTGETIWEHSLLLYDQYGNNVADFLTDIYELSDGSLIAAGGVRVLDSAGDRQSNDSWIIRLDSNGCQIPDCDFEMIFSSTQQPAPVISDASAYTLYPNPATTHISLTSDESRLQRYSYQIMSVDGMLVSTGQSHVTEKISTAALFPGLYMIALFTDRGEYVETKRFIVVE